VTDHPIFVPFRDDRLAAVLTLPDGRPRTLVLLLQGLGPPRSHRFRLWTRVARELAKRGIASVRMDYLQMGDSTGVMSATLNDPPVEESIAVARVAMRAAGVDTCAAVGNCMGGRTALRVAMQLDACRAVGFIVTGEPIKYLAAKPWSQGRGILRKAVRGFRRVVLRGRKPPLRWLPDVQRVASRSTLWFLYVGPEEVGARLARALSTLKAAREGTSVSSVVGEMSNRFELSIPVQEEVLAEIVGWLDRTLPGSAPAEIATEAVTDPPGVPDPDQTTRRRAWEPT
jgi:pimeloyl-ACP methyl ester carboxylesterase